MTIVLGTAVADTGGSNKVYLPAPVGYATGRGIRLSNFTGDTLILTGIDGTNPTSQQYLTPQTQMVYPSVNEGLTPWAAGYAYPPSQVAAGLLVEWSTDPISDFIGTYPTALPTGAITAVGQSKLLYTQSGFSFNNSSFNVGQLTSTDVIVKITVEGSSQVTLYLINITNGLTNVAVYWAVNENQVSNTIYIPVKLSNINADTIVTNVGIGSTGYPSGATLSVYSAPEPINVPYVYTDVVRAGGIPLANHGSLSGTGPWQLTQGLSSGTATDLSCLKQLGMCVPTLTQYFTSTSSSTAPDPIDGTLSSYFQTQNINQFPPRGPALIATKAITPTLVQTEIAGTYEFTYVWQGDPISLDHMLPTYPYYFPTVEPTVYPVSIQFYLLPERAPYCWSDSWYPF